MKKDEGTKEGTIHHNTAYLLYYKLTLVTHISHKHTTTQNHNKTGLANNSVTEELGLGCALYYRVRFRQTDRFHFARSLREKRGQMSK